MNGKRKKDQVKTTEEEKKKKIDLLSGELKPLKINCQLRIPHFSKLIVADQPSVIFVLFCFIFHLIQFVSHKLFSVCIWQGSGSKKTFVRIDCIWIASSWMVSIPFFPTVLSNRAGDKFFFHCFFRLDDLEHHYWLLLPGKWSENQKICSFLLEQLKLLIDRGGN